MAHLIQKPLILLLFSVWMLSACNNRAYKADTPLLSNPVSIPEFEATGYWMADTNLANCEQLEDKSQEFPDQFDVDPQKSYEENLKVVGEYLFSDEHLSKRYDASNSRYCTEGIPAFLYAYSSDMEREFFPMNTSEPDLSEMEAMMSQYDASTDNTDRMAILYKAIELIQQELGNDYSFFSTALFLKVKAHLKALGEVPAVLNDYPHGRFLQKAGNKRYLLKNETSRQLGSAEEYFKAQLHPSSGLFAQHYILEFEGNKKVSYAFISKQRFGSWSMWVKDEAAHESLWEARTFETEQQLTDFATQVFDGNGFLPMELTVNELDRSDVLFLKRYFDCFKRLRLNTTESIDDLNMCV